MPSNLSIGIDLLFSAIMADVDAAMGAGQAAGRTWAGPLDVIRDTDFVRDTLEGAYAARERGMAAGREQLAASAALAKDKDIDEAISSWEEMNKALGDSAKAFGQTEKAKHKLDKNLKKTTETTETFLQKVMRLGGKLRSVSRLFFYASLDMKQFADAILGPMRRGLAIFEDYNRTMTQMRVNFEFLRGTGEESLALLEEKFKEVAESTEFSRLQLAKTAAVFGTAGIAAEEIAGSLEDLANLARVSFTDMEDVARATLRTMRRFHINMEEASHEMWRLAAISQYTGESLTDIANQMGYAVEMGQELGFSFAEIAASMAVLTELYGSSSIAGRRLANVYARLIEVGEEYGIQIRSASGEMLEQRDQIANLADYLDLIGDPIEQSQYLMSLFGKTGAATARALVDAFESGRLDEVMADTGDAMIDTMKELSGTIKKELYVSLEDLRASVDDLALTLGEQLAPTIKEVIGPITKALQKLQLWIAENGELIVSLGAIALALAGLAVIIQVFGFLIEIGVALATLIGALGAAFGFLQTVIVAVAWTFGVGLGGAIAIVAGVIALIILAIIFLVGTVKGFIDVMQEAVKTNEGLQNVMRVATAIFRQFEGVLKIIVAAILIVIGIVFKVGEAFGWFLGTVVSLVFALEPVADIFNAIAGAAEWLADVLNTVGDALFAALEPLMPGSPTMAERFYELGDAIRSTLDPMREAGRLGKGLQSSIGNMNTEMTLGHGAATAGALMTGRDGVGGAGVTYINIDGAYIQDPEELASIIAERQTRESRRNYRRTAY